MNIKNLKNEKRFKIKNSFTSFLLCKRRQKYIMIKLFSLFSGIGAFEKALERMKIPYELVGFSEIDKFAIKSYCAIHNV